QLGFGWLTSIHPDDREATKELAKAAMQKRELFQLDYRLRRYDGEYRSVIDTASPRFAHGGEFLGYIGAVTDITERKLVEEALSESEERYRNVVERSEEHTSELQSRGHLVCRLLLEKKNYERREWGTSKQGPRRLAW